MLEITSEQEAIVLEELRKEVDKEMEFIIPDRGRELLKGVGVFLLPRSYISDTIVFDSFRSREDKKMNLWEEASDKIYSRLGFDPDQVALWIWAFYPQDKRLAIIDNPG